MATKKPPPTKPTDGPAVGVPGGQATRFLRVDFPVGITDVTQFADFIETKTPRLVWSRAVECSCQGFAENNITKQPDPNCPKCSALGWRYFRPKKYAVNTALVGELTAAQQAIVDDMSGVVIRGYIGGMATQPDIFQALGRWALGSAMITVRPENVMGYYDRICQIDDVAPFSQKVTVDADDGDKLPTRYPAVQVNFIASLDKEYDADVDFVVSTKGVITWKAGKTPPADTVLSVHYLYHPVWVAFEYANLIRSSVVAKNVAHPETPAGNLLRLPQRMMLRLEYLPLGPNTDA